MQYLKQPRPVRRLRQPPCQRADHDILVAVAADEAAAISLRTRDALRAYRDGRRVWGVSSNGPENWSKLVIRRVLPGLRGRNQAVLPRCLPELDV